MARRREVHEFLIDGARTPGAGKSRAWSARLRAEFPELDLLTRGERKTWILALHIRRPVRRFAGEVLLVIGLIVGYVMVSIVGLTVVYAGWRLGEPLIGSPIDFPGNLLLAVIIGLWLVMSGRAIDGVIRMRDQRRWQRLLRAELGFGRSACASCHYDLSGVSAIPDRPGVVRCPECALINPAPTTNA